MFLKIIRNRKA